jgi:hypothetical protein
MNADPALPTHNYYGAIVTCPKNVDEANCMQGSCCAYD